ncbi:glycosyltransferase family 2 protein [Rubrobacter marinus]|uniref:glycosyltransferase family 2 protein n=1 Tax=Rubrobacter marinus TaxID=2653852 RepID=UPI001A9DA3E6|nr:glycosyltransferase family 2 protein [Rubrobacter marinus]
MRTTGTFAAARRIDRTGENDASRARSLVRVAAVIPALNEAPSIAGVVGKLRDGRAVAFCRIVVVDNGSTDGTGERARRAGATVVREERRGYGYACRAGVLAAGDADVIVLLDGDAADETSDLPRLLEPLLGDRADLVVGSRVALPGLREPGSMTPQQVLGNRLATFLIRLLYGTEVTDLGPLRAIRREDLLALGMGEMTYGWSVEMMAKAIRAGYRYREVPVTYHRRVGVSKVGGTLSGSLRAGWCIISATLRYSRWLPRVPGERGEIR